MEIEPGNGNESSFLLNLFKCTLKDTKHSDILS